MTTDDHLRSMKSENLESVPVLRQWRIVNSVGIGEVSNHPWIENGWMTTSRILEVADDHTWMQTESRLYRLESPIPDDEPMPAGAKDAILARILRSIGNVGFDQLDKLHAIVDRIAGPNPPN